MAGPVTGAAALKKIAETAARIFGNVLGTGERSGRKLLNKPLIGETVATYYPPDVARFDPLYEDPLEKRRKVKLERLKRRGKSPPKKGQGKRASKGK